jgi:hypothetical protein
VWLSLANLSGCLDSAQERERIVDHGDIRFGLQRFFDRFLAVGRLGNDVPAGMRFQDRPQTRADNLMIVGNEDSGHDRPAGGFKSQASGGSQAIRVSIAASPPRSNHPKP